jgi:hypothetical protein
MGPTLSISFPIAAHVQLHLLASIVHVYNFSFFHRRLAIASAAMDCSALAAGIGHALMDSSRSAIHIDIDIDIYAVDAHAQHVCCSAAGSGRSGDPEVEGQFLCHMYSL